MNRRLIISIVVIAIILLGAVALVALLTRNNSQKSAEATIIGNKLVIETNIGRVLTDNVYSHQLTNYPDNGVGFAHSHYYDMSYYPQDDGFIITLLDPDVQTANTLAEQDFLKILNITKIQACALKVSIGVPYNVNPDYAGKNFTFSYCLK